MNDISNLQVPVYRLCMSSNSEYIDAGTIGNVSMMS